LAPQHHCCGGKPKILSVHRSRMRELLARKPDMSLAELREAVAMDCTPPAVRWVFLSPVGYKSCIHLRLGAR
jgi:hypothetical protein